MQQAYAMQAQAAGDPRVRDVLARLEREEADLAVDLGHLLRRHGRPWIPCGPLAWAIGGMVGFVTVVLGTRASLRFAHWAEQYEVARVDGIAALLPSEDGITGRALQAIQYQDVQHVRMLQEQIRRLTPVRHRGRRR
jgi:demethoxyubiquinone hydroxylase (CLK1/Coq7/Cat5 family)